MAEKMQVKVVRLIAVTEKSFKETTDKYGEIKKQSVLETNYFDFDGNFIASVQEEEYQLSVSGMETRELTDRLIQRIQERLSESH